MIADNPGETEIKNETKTPKSNFNLLELGNSLVRSSTNKLNEKTLIIIGDKGSGKSSCFNIITQSNPSKGNYNPTCGINYGYIRNTQKKILLNLYEIGGGIQNLGLIKTILKDLKNTTIIINLDFSQPHTVLNSLLAYLNKLHEIIRECFDSSVIEDLIEEKRMKYPQATSQLKRIKIFPGEVIVIGNKYDVLEKVDVEKIKWTCRTLRFFCHVNSLSLIYLKSNDQRLSKVFIGLITHITFGKNEYDTISNLVQKNDILPLFIMYGKDTFEEIGDTKVMQQGGRDELTLWEDTFNSLFPQKEKEEGSFFNENSLKDKFIEPRIDEELRMFERKMENPISKKPKGKR